MPTPQRKAEQIDEAKRFYVEHGSIQAASRASGIPPTTLRRILKSAGLPPSTAEMDCRSPTMRELRRAALRGEVGAPPIPDIAKPPEGFVIRRNSGEYDADGNLQRQWIESGQGNADGYAVPDGHVVKGESVLLDANDNVIVKWIKTREDGATVGLVEALQQAFANYKDTGPIVPAPAYSEARGLTVYPLPDLHLGQYSWGVETGADYDVEIAADTALNAIDALLGQSRPTRYAALVGLGDYFHCNDQTNATPAHKNRLDADTRFARVLTLGAHLATKIVDRVARKHPEVETVFLPGNHDPEAALALSVALSLFYSKNPRIKVWNNPSLVWCRRFGRCFIAATHGHTMKAPRFRSFLTARYAREWGLTTFRIGLMGHVHHESADEEGGIRIESFQTPAAPDAHATGSGYVAGRSLSAITFDAERGEVGRHRVNIESPPTSRDSIDHFSESYEDVAA